MFGYVKAYAPELKLRENEFYRAVYCGLCREMKRVTGRASTLTLSYDMVFLTLTRLAITGEHCELAPQRCFLHPLRRSARLAMKSCAQLRYSAVVSALLTERKLDDDVSDERGAKRLYAKMLLPQARRRLRRSDCDAELIERVGESLKALYAEEKESSESGAPPSADRGAEIFGDMLGYIFAYGIAEKTSARLAYEIGRGCGRYIYIADAADDLADDIRRGGYNALLSLWRDEISDGRLSERARESVFDAAKLELSRAAGAIELIETPDGGCPEPLDIIKNIIYLGMPAALKTVLDGGSGKTRGRRSGKARIKK